MARGCQGIFLQSPVICLFIRLIWRLLDGLRALAADDEERYYVKFSQFGLAYAK